MKLRTRTTISPFLVILCWLYCLLSALAPFATPHRAVADAEVFAYVGGDAYFYTDCDENRGLFLLPKTYFVKVLSVEGEFCKIEYLYDDAYCKKVSGYAKTSDLTFVDYTPTTPYLYHVFELRYTIAGAPTDSSSLSQITVTCAYYGDYYIGTQSYAYILRGGEFGYIPKPSNLTFAENPEYANRLQNDTPAQPPSSGQTDAMSPLQIGVLIAVCLLVPTVVTVLVKTPKRTPSEQEE
ncbi:MAG: hypothetical protein IJ996_05730 [Clostridia bacterium]|nr:hypothetical protein [Clostridia bacterium]